VAPMTLLGRTGLAISRLGIGTWAIGGGNYEFGWGPQDDDASEAMLHQALAAGLNWIDTAPAYGLGRAEALIGRALEGCPARPFLFTKCSRRWREDGSFYSCLRRDSVRRELEASLRRLRADCVDLYQIHRPWPEEQLAEGWETLAQLQQEGLVRHIGVSYVTAAQLRMLETIAPVETVQPEYNLLRRDIERDVLPYCAARGIGVLAYSPMASGLLTGTFSAERVAGLPDDDWRKHDPQYTGAALRAGLRVAGLLREISAETGCSPGAAAVAWVLHNPAVSGAIVGFRNPGQVAGLTGSGELTLTAGQLSRLDAATSDRTDVLS
jgi:aryl-alcohol dehydrogenase-like predicted oxidoreductase